MTVETQQISELFKDPRRINRTTPFNRIASHTYGKGAMPRQQGDPGPGNDPGPPSKPRPDDAWDGTGRPPGWMTAR